MKRHTFRSKQEYLQAQRELSQRKIHSPDLRHFITQPVVDAIRELCPNVRQGLCHGVRRGVELDLFQSAYPSASWIGTEILPELCDGKRIIPHDFNEPRQDWYARFDLIFSNSFDHAEDPQRTLRTWFQQLSFNGVLYLEWSLFHERLGRDDNRADCFAATVDELLCLSNSVGIAKVAATVTDVRQRGRYKGQPFNRSIIEVRNGMVSKPEEEISY